MSTDCLARKGVFAVGAEPDLGADRAAVIAIQFSAVRENCYPAPRHGRAQLAREADAGPRLDRGSRARRHIPFVAEFCGAGVAFERRYHPMGARFCHEWENKPLARCLWEGCCCTQVSPVW